MTLPTRRRVLVSVVTLVASLMLLLTVNNNNNNNDTSPTTSVLSKQNVDIGSLRRRLSSIAPTEVQESSSEQQLEPTTESTEIAESSNNNTVTLKPGDLPGYTGWARPATTDAQYYRLVGAPSTKKPVPVNRMLKFQIACTDEIKCSNTNNRRAQFYARMYGPSVLPGHVTNMGANGAYEITFFPQDVGTYFVEVVLTFSDTPDFKDYPFLKAEYQQKSMGYEGHLLPSFPYKVEVGDTENAPPKILSDDRPLPICSAKDLLLTDMMDGLTVGRWQVTSKSAPARLNTEDKEETKTTSDGQLMANTDVTAINSITMDYQPRASCSLVPISSATDHDLHHLQRLDSCLYDHVAATYKTLRLILIGDSVMGMQYQMLKQLGIPGIELSYIYAGGGLEVSFANVTQQMNDIALSPNSKDEERMVLFNSGLHDITVLFNQMRSNEKNATQLSESQEFYRTFHYRQQLERWIDFMATYPASQTIFQLTTAAWPKWGNWGVSWPQHKEQPFQMSTHWAEQYNRIAMHVIGATQQDSSRDNIQIMDAYWMSLARPDHREISVKGRRAKLAHPGQEVITAMVRTYLTVVVSQLGCMAY